jgi:uncharacterized membrane protein YdbT with pleckstrin-like domain
VTETKTTDAEAATGTDEIEDPDPRLMAGETVVFKTHKHWFAPVADSGVAVLAIIGALILTWLQTDQATGVIGFGNRVLNLVSIALFLFGVGSIIYNIIAWRSAKYVVTNHRILGDEGLLRKRSTDTLLQSISDVRYRQSAIGKAFGFGDVQILSSSGEAGADKFTTVVKADMLKKTALEQKIAGSTPAAAPASAPAAPSTASSGQAETMATLTSLAALRDSGAITAEEYEAKKQQLLSRI